MKLSDAQERVLFAICEGGTYTDGKVEFPDGQKFLTSPVVAYNLRRMGLMKPNGSPTPEGEDESSRRAKEQGRELAAKLASLRRSKTITITFKVDEQADGLDVTSELQRKAKDMVVDGLKLHHEFRNPQGEEGRLLRAMLKE